MPISKFLFLPFLLAFLIAGCSTHQTEIRSEAPPEASADSVPPETAPQMDEEFVDLDERPAPEPLVRDWSLQDRALAFNPALQNFQATFDRAVAQLADGDYLLTQSTLDSLDAHLEIADEDSLGNGLTQLYLASLRKRVDRLQEILDEESIMNFAAPLSVADDSLIALWYGGLPEISPRPMELQINDRVQHWIDVFSGPSHKQFQEWLDRGEKYRPLMDDMLARYELPRELYYLAMIESGFVLDARSSAGAVGPWQFIRGTGRRYGLAIDWWVDERRDPVRSTEAACQYLSHLYGIFQDWNLAMAGYNSGEFRVMTAVRRAGSRDFWDLKLPRQTRDYVPKMMAAAHIGENPERYGFEIRKPDRPYLHEELLLDRPVDLSLIAKKGGFRLSRLKAMNPHLLRWCTPPDHGDYAVHVPRGKLARLQNALAALAPGEEVSFKRHKVRRGETLYDLAKGYGTTVQAIMRQNNISNPRTLAAGSNLLIPTHPDQSFNPPAIQGVASHAAENLPFLEVPEGQMREFYSVRKGENLSFIARKLDVTVAQLQQWNGLGRSSRIYPNQVLQYLRTAPPGYRSAGAFSGTRRTHVVKSGENLFQISRLYGATVYDLLDWNPSLRGKNALIHPGEELVVYVKG